MNANAYGRKPQLGGRHVGGDDEEEDPQALLEKEGRRENRGKGQQSKAAAKRS